MPFSVEENYFSDAETVTKEIADAGLYQVELESEPLNSPSHWHDFGASLYVTEGVLTLTDDTTGTTYTCDKGSKISAPARTLHTEVTDGYKFILGLEVDPATIEEPINRSPEDL